MHKQPTITRFPFRRRPAAKRCYCCDGQPVGFALRDIDGGPALGDTVASLQEIKGSPRTVRRPACSRHAWPSKWIAGGAK